MGNRIICYNVNMPVFNLNELIVSSRPSDELYEMDRENTLKDTAPFLANLRMEIPEGYSHKDNLTHSIKVLENAVSFETQPDLVLRTAALLHDIGKPFTRRFASNGSVSFFSHEVKGAQMVKKVLPSHGYSEKDIHDIALLVSLHMRAYGFRDGKWADAGVRRLITDAQSPAMVERLLILFRSDVTTRIEAKKSFIYKNLDDLETHIKEVVRADNRALLRPSLNGNEVMELFGLEPGKQLGRIMKFLNTDEGVALNRAEAIRMIREQFQLELSNHHQVS